MATIDHTRIDDSIVMLTLTAPDGLNILGIDTLRALAAALSECADDKQTSGVVLTGSGRAFSVGADIDEFPYGEDAYPFLTEVLSLLSAPERFPKPIVAAVDTLAMAGGFELALACDWIVASPDARMGLSEVRFGFVPGYCMSRLPFLIGEARARRMMLDPGPYDVRELMDLGIHVSACTDDETAVEGATRICRRMTGGAPISVRLVKGMTNRFERSPDFEPIVNAYNYLFSRPEAAEGRAAFKERRQPRF